MKLLLDTHILLWASGPVDLLSAAAARLLADPGNQLYFSVVNLWEVAIKHSLRREDFRADPTVLRHGLLANGYHELQVTGDQAIAVGTLPHIHRDPFDRLLIAQAQVEGITLLTADKTVARYPGTFHAA